MSSKTKVKIARIVCSAVLLGIAYAVEHAFDLQLWQALLLYLLPYAVAGYDVVLEAWESITEGECFNEDLLMTIATVGALLIGFVPNGSPMFDEAVFVMLFFQVGEVFEHLASDNSKKSIAKLMDIRPDSATVERDGQLLTISPEEIKLGEIILVKPGDRVPVDAEIVEGSTSLDTVALTGESVPRDATVGDNIISGCVNLSGVVRARVTHLFEDSTASRIIKLVESSNQNKSKSERFIRRFSRVYTPAVVYSAIALAFLPPLLSGDFVANVSTWVVRALTFLIASCPCALVVSVPLAFFGGIGAASKEGILIKGSAYIDMLSTLDTVAFDKTGTLTEGVFEVLAVHPQAIGEKDLLHLASHVEMHSTHPIAAALRAAYPSEDDDCVITDIKEIAGQGICANVNGKSVAVGNCALMESVGASWKACENHGTIIHVAVDGTYMGHIVISDRERADAPAAIASLKNVGVSKVVMLTGDKRDVAEEIAAQMGITEVRSELLPQDKVAAVEGLLAQKTAGKSLAFVGDGINDAPVLARADVGVAMGGLGSDAAIEAADVVLMDDKLSKLSKAVKIARHTLGIAKQNIVFAIGVKVAVLILAAFGLAPMWLAVFGDIGVMVLAVLNSTRALNIKSIK
ncbi:ATPase P [Lancefieldella parvula DNF00906]|uniref:heavy metal translocating P-type ATPase n=1 Tax=Lancefieldella parvula TaxID=1382 RepID=UPI00050FB556|nr:heavy metal translocating P-type ATPase [Lancefieldella parvula]KGF13305.1 ATPase P [Lancefieldella parvula DNF00906]MBF0919715.1 cadmium-translocating P-type ATPase [Atopobium sp.]